MPALRAWHLLWRLAAARARVMCLGVWGQWLFAAWRQIKFYNPAKSLLCEAAKRA